MNSEPLVLLFFPAEIILHIFSYLDIPDLDAISSLSPELRMLAQDPALHHHRIRVVAPSRIGHSLFARDGTLRPTVADLVHWGFIRGLGIERRWRNGLYFYSPQSVKQYESSQRLQRTHVKSVLSTHLLHVRSAALRKLHKDQVLPDVECASPFIARSLLPVVRKLKWCIRRDELAKMVRSKLDNEGSGGSKNRGWFEGDGYGLWQEHERIRLAICPGVRQFISFFESVSSKCH